MSPLLRFAIVACCSAILAAGEVETVGSCGDPATLVLVGVKTFREQDVRQALAGDLPVLLARRPEAPRAEWLRLVEDGVRQGYRRAGFRDAVVAASVAEGRTRVQVEEGQRTRCGEVRVPGVPPEIAAMARAALAERRNPQAGMYEIDTAPESEEPLWAVGAPLDWDRVERYAERIGGELRRAGLVGGRIAATVDAADGRAALTLGLDGIPVTARLGRIVVAGLGAGDGERLRRWLDLPAESPATGELAEAVYKRLRSSGSFIEARVVWEDQVMNLPPAVLKMLPIDEIGAALREDAAVMYSRIVERGRADLIITVRPVPQAAMPWEEASRTRTTMLASRSVLMRRLSGGAELVATTAQAGVRLRMVWSPVHGFAWLQDGDSGRPGSALVLGDGWLATRRAGRQLHARISAPQFTIGIAPNQGEDRDRSPFTLTANCSRLGALPRVQLDLLPAGFVSMLLRIGQDDRPAEQWDGDVLVLAYSGSTFQVRCDPVAGPSLRFTLPQRAAIDVSVQDGIWEREVAPLLAGGQVPDRHPLGTVLGEAIAIVRDTVPEVAALPGLERIAAIAHSGAVDALLDLTAAPAGAEAFSIPTDFRRPRLPMMQYMIAAGAAYLDGRLYDRLARDAWPRLLLYCAAQAMSGDMRTAAAGMKPIFEPGRVGPLGCLVFAHATRMTGNAMLTGLIADAGERCCDAEGLALEARTLAGFAPVLLPSTGAMAEMLAVSESDPARAAALRALASTCFGPEEASLRLESAARQAAALGAAEALKRLFAELRTGPAR